MRGRRAEYAEHRRRELRSRLPIDMREDGEMEGARFAPDPQCQKLEPHVPSLF